MRNPERPFKNDSLASSFKNAFSGMAYMLRHEKNLMIHIGAGLTVIIAGIILGLSPFEFAVLFLTVGLVVICELFNTVIEVVVDMITEEYSEKAKIAKDISAGAVFISSAVAVAVGIAVFAKYIIALFK